MKRTGLALALLLLAAGLVADPLFCCALAAQETGPRFTAAPMDCCAEEESGCPPTLERAASVPLATLDSAAAVPQAHAAEEGPTLLRPPVSEVPAVHPAVRRPPRLHLVHSQFRI